MDGILRFYECLGILNTLFLKKVVSDCLPSLVAKVWGFFHCCGYLLLLLFRRPNDESKYNFQKLKSKHD